LTRGAGALLVLLALTAVAATPAPGAPADEAAAARAAFVAAYEAAEAGRPDGDAAVPQDYPLHPYLQAARLRQALRAIPGGNDSLPADEAARAFLDTHGEDPVGRIVRAAWLESLAQRRRWREFLDAYAGVGATDQTLRCQALTAHIALGPADDTVEQARLEWLTPASAPDECDAVFDWLRREGRLDSDLVEQRARLALAAGESRLARWLARSLPEAAARPVRDWATLLEQPQAAIDAIIRRPDVAVEPEALLAGWTKLARRDPLAARERFRPLVSALGLDSAAASPFARELALGLSWNRRPALSYFAKVRPGDFDELTHAWHVRAAVWQGDWKAVAQAIEAMPEPLRGEAAWRYWLARALERRGERERARELYAAVVPSDNWYAVLSAARLGQPFAPHPVALEFDAARVAALGADPAFVRARELLAAGLPHLAPAEWRHGYEPLDPPGQRAAVKLAHQWGWHFQAIASAAQQRFYEDYVLFYPRPFADEVAGAARASRLPATLVYAVMRQESLFQPYAVSPAGAVGLMQLLPSTARLTAAAMGRPRPSPASLQDPAVNLPLGAGHLAELADRFDGQLLLALAAYNAGPRAVARWLPDERLDADAWVENIPFNETRGYVQRVMWHSVVFEWLVDGEPADASGWLVQVDPGTR